MVFEGADGSGKSTQLKRFAQFVRDAGVPVCDVREPGGTAVGEQIRSILLAPAASGAEMTLRCEMLLYMASRVQLLEERILPSLAKGELVLADRFVSSTYAYQGAAGGLPREEIEAVAAVATQRVKVELVVIFDVDTATATLRTRGVDAQKSKSRRRTAGKPGTGAESPGGPANSSASSSLSSTLPSSTLFDDRIEQRSQSFHEKVRFSYLDQAKADPGRHLVIDASVGPEQVWERLLAAMAKRFG